MGALFDDAIFDPAIFDTGETATLRSDEMRNVYGQAKHRRNRSTGGSRSGSARR